MKRWGLGAALAALVMAGCSAAPAAPAAGLVAMNVWVYPKVTTETPSNGAPCTVGDNFGDVAQGAAVTIRDGKGEVVAMGSMPAGVVDFRGEDPAPYAFVCKFSLTVTNVPKGRNFYSIEVANRGRVNFEESALFGTVPALTIGL